jgi:hypothetical protein
MRLVEMTKHFKRFDLLDATDGSLKLVTSPEPLYLIDDYAEISIKEICKSIRFFRIYEKDYHIQNLEWSELFLEQSCDDQLKKKVLENTMNVTDLEKGGPVHTLTLKLSTFTIPSIQGENISKVSQLRGAYRHLVISEKCHMIFLNV